MKNLILSLVVGLLIGSSAIASPLTADQIYGTPSLQFIIGPNQSLPSGIATLSPIGLLDSIVTANSAKTNYQLAQSFVYDFATLGGGSGSYISIAPSTALNGFPANAIITNAFLDITSAVTGSGASVAIQGLAAGDILSTTGVASLGVKQLQGNPVAGSMSGVIKGATGIVVHITGAALTGGHFTLFLDYSLSQ